MAGGGKPGNKNAEKWNEEKSIELGDELVKWMKASDENIFFKQFFLIEKDLNIELPAYLAEKFESFNEYYKKAKSIQEYKLAKFGIEDRLNATMTIFVLKNIHGWKDRHEHEHSGQQSVIWKEEKTYKK